MACGAALLTGLVNSFARVNQGGCPTAVEIRKGTWFAAGQSQLRRSGIVVETSGLTRAPQSQGQPAARARPALFKPIAEVETTDYADDTDAEAVLSVWSGLVLSGLERAKVPLHPCHPRHLRFSIPAFELKPP